MSADKVADLVHDLEAMALNNAGTAFEDLCNAAAALLQAQQAEIHELKLANDIANEELPRLIAAAESAEQALLDLDSVYQQALILEQGATERAVKAEQALAEMQQTFNLRWKADMRAIERWRAEAPGRELTLPDHADLCVWLLQALAEAHATIKAFVDGPPAQMSSTLGLLPINADGMRTLVDALAEAQRDAERYRWAKANDWPDGLSGDVLDAAIDAAIQQGERNG